MIKCIYRDFEEILPHCDKEADYIYIGKSYCAEHLEIRAAENKQIREEQEEELKKLESSE